MTGDQGLDLRTKGLVVGGPLMAGLGGQNRKRERSFLLCLSWDFVSLQGESWEPRASGVSPQEGPTNVGQALGSGVRTPSSRRTWERLHCLGLGQLGVPRCYMLTSGPCRSGHQPFPATSCPLRASHPGCLWPGSLGSHLSAPSHCPPRLTSDPSGPWPPPHPKPEAPPACLMAMLCPLGAGTFREPPSDCHPCPDWTLGMQ